MSEFPPDLERLLVIRTYLQLQLREVEARIRAHRQVAGEGRSPTAARAALPSAQSSDAELRWWRFVPDRAGTGGGILHRRDCRSSRGGALLTGEEAAHGEQPNAHWR